MARHHTSKTYKLYGLDFSLFTAETRSYLRKKGSPFEEVSVSWGKIRSFINGCIGERTGVEFIPVVHTPDDKVIQDTTVIIDELERRFPEHSVYPDTPSLLRRFIGKKASAEFRGMLPGLGVTAADYRAIETAYENFLEEFDGHLEIQNYVLGDKPCIADFGLMALLYALSIGDALKAGLKNRLVKANNLLQCAG